MQNSVSTLFGDTPAPARAQVIAVTSGKGGVGKTSVSTNLAVCLARRGKRVCIFDADTGLANINILLGLHPQHTLEQFLDGSLDIDELLLEGPRGVRIVPGASGIAEFADLDRSRQQALVNALRSLETRFDYLLIDTAAGIAATVVQFVLAASQALLVISPDPTSLTDAFALCRVLKRNGFTGRIHAVVNMAEGADAARKVYQRFAQAAEKYLQIDVEWFGHVSADRALVSAIRLQHPVVLAQPDAPSSRCFEQLATQLEAVCEGAAPERGLSDFLRDKTPESAVDPARAAIELLRGATAAVPLARPADLGELNRQFVDCIQGSKDSPEELVAAIKPIIDAFVARFHCFPLDMREAIYRYLEIAELPDQEIRGQVMLLEQLYEKRYQRPLMDKEDSLFRLLNQVRDSEAEFAATIARLQQNYERQYRPGPREALSSLAERLRREEATEDDFVDSVETLRGLFRTRFGREYSVPDLALRERMKGLLGELIDQEAARQDALAILTSEIAQSAQQQERLQLLLDGFEDT